MADSVRRDKVIERRLATGVADNQIDCLVVAIREKGRPRVGGERLDVARAVVFLVLARLLVLLENARQIVLGVERRDDARLRMGAHRLAIGVELRLGVLDERSVGHQRIQRLAGLGIRLG